MYHKGASQSTVSLNCKYNVIFCNLRDASQLRTLDHQMQPGNARWLLVAFDDATSRPYGYLLLEHYPESDPDLRVLIDILPSQRLTIYCCCKNYIKKLRNLSNILTLHFVSMTRKSSHNKAKVIKRTVKYLSIAPDNEVVRAKLQQAHDGVICAFSNAALNARQGDVHIEPNTKAAFATHNRKFDIMTDVRQPLQYKRRIQVKCDVFSLVIAHRSYTKLYWQ